MTGLRVQTFEILTVRKALAFWASALILGMGSSLAAEEPESLSHILTRQTEKTFDLVQHYLQEHPDAPDRETAYEWLFETAREEGWESKALPLADKYLEQVGRPLPAGNLATQVRTVGLAKSGQWEGALIDFERQLAGVRLKMPTEIVALAKTLAYEAQAAGKPDIAKDIYRSLSRSLLLNPEVKQLCETKLAKLDLIGKPAPKLTVKDLSGQDINLERLKGQWVLLDFWATDCAPCLKDLPELKRLFEAYQTQGMAIIGISLDEDANVVREFRNARKLTWALALSNTDGHRTREKYHVPTIPAMCLINPKGEVELIDPSLRELDLFLKTRLKPAEKPSP